ncbi:unnamed protein product [Moneuplotes crassus]|uniref:Uncharacterized protein n=1 Tax=Euplotes crassus TaxID=5936 RepID=A0AAD2D8D3_EUPCR|nr:unnamed protein product [Moneuplotes crassus]
MIQDVIIDTKVKGYMLDQKISKTLPGSCANSCIETCLELSKYQISAYDFESQPVDKEDEEPSEPIGSTLDLWSKETVDVVKGPVVIKKTIVTKKDSLKSNLKPFSDGSSRSLKSKSSKRLKRKENTIPDSSIYKQHPLKTNIDEEIEDDDNKWRKYLIKKAKIEDNFRRAMENDHPQIRRGAKHKTKILTNLAIDSKGRVMKKKKVDVEKLPVEDTEHALIKVHHAKRLRTSHIDREEYLKRLNDPNRKNLIKINESMETAEREFAEVQNKLHKEKIRMEKAKQNGKDYRNINELDSSGDEVKEDLYNVEDIYSRDLMSQQQRRFGSPVFAVRNNSMMYELPTNNLEQVKPGVELKECENPLKGDKYEQNPYHEIEVDVTETDDQYDCDYENLESSNNLEISPIEEDSEEREDEIESKELETIESETLEGKTACKRNTNIFKAKVGGKMKALLKNPAKFQSRLSIRVPNFEKVFDASDLLETKEPMTARNKAKLMRSETLIQEEPNESSKAQTPYFKKDAMSVVGNKRPNSITQSKFVKRSSTTNFKNGTRPIQVPKNQGKVPQTKRLSKIKMKNEKKKPVKQSSKFTPEVAQILEMMDQKQKVPKKRIVTRYQLSRGQYLKRLEEENNSKAKNFPFSKDLSEKSEVEKPEPRPDSTVEGVSEPENPGLPKVQSESQLPLGPFSPPKSQRSRKPFSRNTKSSLNMTKTALNLLLDTFKSPSNLLQSNVKASNMQSYLFNTQNFEDKSRIVNNTDALLPHAENSPDNTQPHLATPQSPGSPLAYGNLSVTSYIPQNPNSSRRVLPKIKTWRQVIDNTSVFITK